MTRKVKMLGLALVAVCAVGGAGAQGAGAATDDFHAEEAPVTLTGSQEGEHVFTLEGNEFKCTTVTFHGTMSTTTATEITLTPHYTGCKFGSLNATMDTTGCHIILDGETTPSTGDAHVYLDCTSGNIKTTMSGCTITFNNDQTLTGVTYDNVDNNGGDTREITITHTVTHLAYSASGFGCGLAGIKTGAHTDGTYVGNTIVTGEEDEVANPQHVGIWVTTTS
jgi:hypothetical protein